MPTPIVSALPSLPPGYTAVVIGASGSIGNALASRLESDPDCAGVTRFSRSSPLALDLTDEASIANAAASLQGSEPRVIFDATGVLSIDGTGPEKALKFLDPETMAKAFAVNTIGPALIFKHFGALLPREGKSVIATLSARVGSIGDNRLGGWLSYRASKAALNQIVCCSAIEIGRKHPDAVCVALHPGTVESDLTRAHAAGRYTFSAADSADCMIAVLDGLDSNHSGSFYAYDGDPIPW